MSTATKLTYLNETKEQIRQGINALGGDLTTEDTFRSYVNALDNIYDYLPKVTDTGTLLTLNNTAKGGLRITLGSSALEQTTYIGKNLLNVPSSYTFKRLIDKPLSLEAGTYIFSYASRVTEGTEHSFLRFTYNDSTYLDMVVNSSTTSYTITLTKPVVSYNLYSQNSYNSSTMNVTFTNLMISTTGGEYEPYVGGTASPNPSYPQDIHTISGSNSIVVEGKNLFDGTGWRLVQSGNGFPQPATGATIVSSDTNNISFTSTQWAYAGVESGFIKVKANETYMFSANFTTPTNRFFITQYDENKTRISTLNYINVSTLQNTSFTTTNDGYIAIAFTNTTAAQTTYKIEDIMIEKGSTATTYTPYVSQTNTIDLTPYNLGSIGNYENRIFKNIPSDTDYSSEREEGAWYIKKNIGKVVLDGSESWDERTNSGGRKQFFCPTTATNIVGLNTSIQYCNYGVFSSSSFNWSSEGQFALLDNTNRFYLGVNNNAVLNDFKTAIASNNVIIYYSKTTPTYTKITGTLENQLENIYKNMLSYKGTTNISQVNNDLPFSLSIVALEDLSS